MKNVLELEFQLTKTKIVFCYGNKAYNKYIQLQFGIEERIAWSGCSIELTNKDIYQIVIGVKKYKDIYALKALLVHELNHTVSQLMEYFGFDCDEFRSYTLQLLYQEIIPFLDNILNKKEK